MQNQNWYLVDLPPGNKPLKCKWIFKKNLKSDGSIGEYKARLIVTQKEEFDFFDT